MPPVRITLPQGMKPLLLVLVLAMLLASLAIPPTVQANALYTAVPVSDIGTDNTLAEPNSSRKVAVGPNGTIYVAYQGSNGVRVARSTNRGQSFEPSVQVSTANARVSIAVDENGVVYTVYISSGAVMFSSSTDGGQTFSTPTNIGSASSSDVDIAADAPYVYVLPRNGQTLFINNNNGQGSFTASSTGLPSLAYSGVLVDPSNGDLFVIGDNPTLYYTRSTDRGATWSSPVSPSGSVFFSTYIGGFGFIGQQVYVAGRNTGGVLIDLTTGTSSPRTFGNNSVNQSRTLAVDGEGNVVDGYSNSNNVYFAISTDSGLTFDTPVTVATNATRMELALNPSTLDVIAVYEQGGNIYLNAYESLIPPPPTPPTISDVPNQETRLNRTLGPIDVTVGDPDGDPSTVTMSGASSNQALVANANITFGGSGTNRTVSITPTNGITGTTTITLTATNSNGRRANDTFVLTVNDLLDQTITFVAPTGKTYGDAPFALDATASSGLPVSYTVVAGPVTINDTTLTITGAGEVELRATQPGNDTYSAAPAVTVTFTVARAALTITAEDKTMGQGEAVPPLTARYDGFVNGDTAASLDTPANLSTTATSSSPLGTYPIVVSDAADANYTITPVNGTLTVVVRVYIPLITL